MCGLIVRRYVNTAAFSFKKELDATAQLSQKHHSPTHCPQRSAVVQPFKPQEAQQTTPGFFFVEACHPPLCCHC